METTPRAPAPLSYAYFQDPPTWVRNLVALLAGILALYGTLIAAVAGMGEEAEPRFVEVGKAIDTPVSSAPTTAEWASFTAADARITATFPGTPERATSPTARGTEMIRYMVDTDTAVFLIAVSPLETGAGFDFDAAADAAAEQMEGEIASKLNMTHQGVPAMEFVIASDGDYFRAMIVRAPDRIVQVVVTSESADRAPYNRFRDSLVIT